VKKGDAVEAVVDIVSSKLDDVFGYP